MKVAEILGSIVAVYGIAAYERIQHDLWSMQTSIWIIKFWELVKSFVILLRWKTYAYEDKVDFMLNLVKESENLSHYILRVMKRTLR